MRESLIHLTAPCVLFVYSPAALSTVGSSPFTRFRLTVVAVVVVVITWLANWPTGTAPCLFCTKPTVQCTLVHAHPHTLPTLSFTNFPAGYDIQFYQHPVIRRVPTELEHPSLLFVQLLALSFYSIKTKTTNKKIRTKMRRAMPRERERTPTKYRVQSIFSFNLIFHYLM